MKEKTYLFHYYQINGEEVPFIWFSVITAPTITQAIEDFEKYVDKQENIIQIIVKDKLQ